MKLNDLESVQIGVEGLLPALQAVPGRRGFLQALMARLMRKWIGLYAAPPRRLPPML